MVGKDRQAYKANKQLYKQIQISKSCEGYNTIILNSYLFKKLYSHIGNF